MNGTQGGHPAIQFRQDTRVTVRGMDGLLPVHVDGEVLSADVKELLIEILPGRLKVISGEN
jgi:diacylglycerol kinase family enzyme